MSESECLSLCQCQAVRVTLTVNLNDCRCWDCECDCHTVTHCECEWRQCLGSRHVGPPTPIFWGTDLSAPQHIGVGGPTGRFPRKLALGARHVGAPDTAVSDVWFWSLRLSDWRGTGLSAPNQQLCGMPRLWCAVADESVSRWRNGSSLRDWWSRLCDWWSSLMFCLGFQNAVFFFPGPGFSRHLGSPVSRARSSPVPGVVVDFLQNDATSYRLWLLWALVNTSQTYTWCNGSTIFQYLIFFFFSHDAYKLSFLPCAQ